VLGSRVNTGSGYLLHPYHRVSNRKSGFKYPMQILGRGVLDFNNPKVGGMDRAHCIMAKCIPRLPCEAPRIGRPITVRGISRYDAEIGRHWWEIHPVEQVEK